MAHVQQRLHFTKSVDICGGMTSSVSNCHALTSDMVKVTVNTLEREGVVTKNTPNFRLSAVFFNGLTDVTHGGNRYMFTNKTTN
mmetsp:Transcript_52980/g.87779  ORF Transcript_52980/g.87779 Transcript_52980/m.87779 type:complete len:84 (+) Transcript_52980:362-613(+)